MAGSEVPTSESKHESSPLEVIEQEIREEEERRMGIWTKIYEGLSGEDQEYLFRSALSVIDKFLGHYPDKLPDIVLLPEISARPLFYLLNPVIKAVCEERQLKPPTFIYFQTHKGYEMSLIDEDGREILTSVKELRRMMDFSEESDPVLQDYLRSEIETREGRLEKARKLRNLMKRRAGEIMNYSRKIGITDPSIVIFDDYVTEQHSSIDEVRLAFGSNIPAYCLLQARDVVFPENLQIFTGMEDPYGTTEIATSQGFNYRSKNEGNRHAVGVDKDENSLYVKNSPSRNRVSMQNLRIGLQSIGQRIAQKL